jgi:hypothetical protein
MIHVAVAHQKMGAPGEVQSGARRSRPQRRLALRRADAGVEEGHPSLGLLDGVGIDRPPRIHERHGHHQPVNAQPF